MKELQEILQRVTMERFKPWALATLVRTHGSTYRKPGARLLADEEGNTVGVLSGGCLEEEIARRGKQVIESGEARVIDFDTRRLYGCDGKLEILLERISPAEREGNWVTKLAEELAARRTVRICTRHEGADIGSSLLQTRELIAENEGVFLQTVAPPIRLLIIGRGPEVEPVAKFATVLGWHLRCAESVAEVATTFEPDCQTAALIMTHNFGRDLAALDCVLPWGLPYTGLLGPRKRHAELMARLLEYREIEPGLLSALHAPAGLDIGSESPEEIALSLVTEIAAVLAGRAGGKLRERCSAIHEPSVERLAA